MKKSLPLLAVVIVVLGGWAAWWLLRPPQRVAATATCGDAEMFESDLGIINIPQLSLGQYLYVDTADGIAYHGSFLDTVGGVVTEPVASLSLQYAASLSVSVAGEVPADVKMQAQEAISRSTHLLVSGMQRRTMPSVMRALGEDEWAPREIPSMLSQHFGQGARGRMLVFVVHAVVTADSLAIGLAGAAEGDLQTELTVGDVQVSVRYDCSQTLSASGSRVPLFFKVTPIGYDEGSGFFLATGANVDFTKVRMAQTAR